tara:strand:- start:527 stop:826 length:300 start_codon:yes stop_codon:yes gene_type:complete
MKLLNKFKKILIINLLDFLLLIFLLKIFFLNSFKNTYRVNYKIKSNWVDPNVNKKNKYNFKDSLVKFEIKLLTFILKKYPNSYSKIQRKALSDYKYEMF